MFRAGLSSLALLAFFFASPAIAADGQPRFYKDHQTVATPRTYLTSEELDKMERMTLEERAAFLQQRRAETAALTEEEREERRAERQAAFNALPAAEQETIKERTQRLIADFKDAPERDVKAERAQAKKNVEEFFHNMTPEEKAAWNEIKKNNKKWKGNAPAPAEKTDE